MGLHALAWPYLGSRARIAHGGWGGAGPACLHVRACMCLRGVLARHALPGMVALGAVSHASGSPSSALVPQLTFLLDDVGIPRNYRSMPGFGVHTFRLIAKCGKETLVKFHWIPKAGGCAIRGGACSHLYVCVCVQWVREDRPGGVAKWVAVWWSSSTGHLGVDAAHRHLQKGDGGWHEVVGQESMWRA